MTAQLFDKVTVLYKGRQIFFGRITGAKRYFYDLGFDCPARMPTLDFLTAMTSPAERIQYVRSGFEAQVPQSADDFEAIWKCSETRNLLLREIAEFE